MDHHDSQKIIEQFRSIRRRQLFVATPFVIVAIVLIILLENPDFTLFNMSRNILYGISGAGVLAGLIFSLINWRCPACNTYLKKNFNPKFCPNCGVKLRES